MGFVLDPVSIESIHFGTHFGRYFFRTWWDRISTILFVAKHKVYYVRFWAIHVHFAWWTPYILVPPQLQIGWLWLVYKLPFSSPEIQQYTANRYIYQLSDFQLGHHQIIVDISIEYYIYYVYIYMYIIYIYILCIYSHVISPCVVGYILILLAKPRILLVIVQHS